MDPSTFGLCVMLGFARGDGALHLISGSISFVSDNDSRLKPQANQVLLKDAVKPDKQVRSALQFSDELLAIRHLPADRHALSHVADAISHRDGNSFHRSSGASRLRNRFAYVGGLSSSNLVHFVDRLSQPLRLNDIDHQRGASEEEREDAEPESPPTLNRVVAAVGLFLGGLLLCLGDFDRHGRSIATALNWSGVLIGSGGLLLLIL